MSLLGIQCEKSCLLQIMPPAPLAVNKIWDILSNLKVFSIYTRNFCVTSAKNFIITWTNIVRFSRRRVCFDVLQLIGLAGFLRGQSTGYLNLCCLKVNNKIKYYFGKHVNQLIKRERDTPTRSHGWWGLMRNANDEMMGKGYTERQRKPQGGGKKEGIEIKSTKLSSGYFCS